MRWAVVFALLFAFILVPFVLFEGWFNALADSAIRAGAHPGYASVAISGLLASDVLLPIPSSIVSTAAGVLLGFWSGAMTVWAGMVASCVLGYAFGARAATRARRFVGEAGMQRAERLSDRYGDMALALCRPIPVLAEATVIVAGIMRRPFRRFLGLTTAANLGVAAAYAAIGAYSMRLDSFVLAFAGSIAVPGIGLLIARRWFRWRS